MCLYPRFIKNKKYTGYKAKRPKKGEATAIPCNDYRKLYVAIGCGQCFECRKQKGQQWRVRLMEELKVNKYAYFVTLTFSNENYEKIRKTYEIKENDYNKIATKAVRLFLERWRKKHKKSLKHWLITELGHENTERLHIHGIIFTEEPINNDIIANYWQYGLTFTGEYCNEKTINYIIKYVLKVDKDHKLYMPLIMCSAGMGKNFAETYSAKLLYKYQPNESPEYYLLKDGNKVALPIYYRNKLYTAEERDKMWTERLDRHTLFVNGVRITDTDTIDGQQTYYSVLQTQQEWNEKIGYGKPTDHCQTLQKYKDTFEKLQQKIEEDI